MNGLRATLLIGTAVLLLVPGFPSETASAEEEGEAGGSTIELHPGWNMVGWLGPETPGGQLFQAMPSIEEVWLYDSASQRYRGGRREAVEGALTLTPGVGFWLYLGGETAVRWERPVASEGVVLRLGEGSNLVAWAGEGSPVEGPLTRLGDSLVFAAWWNAEQQRYEFFHPGAPDSFNTLAALPKGEAVWIEMSEQAYWWVPGTQRPRFEFASGIEVAEQEALRHEVDLALAIFAESFGVHTTDFTVSARTRPGCSAGGKVVTTTRSGGCLAHEYFHILQFALAAGGTRGPNWMIEGPAVYAEALYYESPGQERDDRGYDRTRWFAVTGSVNVPSLEQAQNSSAPAVNYDLGFLVTEWLVEHAGRYALIDYYRRLASSSNWESAFEGAFGISVDDFYLRFEAHRANVAPPLPHLTDGAVTPVVAFLGNVPRETQEEVQAELDSVTTFLTRQLGVELMEYTVFIAEDSDAARATFERHFGATGLTVEQACSIAGGVTLHVLTCPQPLPGYRTHIGNHVAALTADKGHDNPPLWLSFGGESYLKARYRLANGLTDVWGLTFEEELAQHTQTAKQSAVTMRQIEHHDGWSAASDSETIALEFLAFDWLVRRAGEASIVEFYRLLPRGHPSFPWHEPNAGSWQAAFEQAFGLTVDDFYEAFADYRSGLQ
ncbi:MAG: hypothetical protein OXG61_00355 [Chloroflexi bacterium]|nr:hypothetical protein [Chloroflexota bacterium]